MDFEHLRIKDIDFVVNYKPQITGWECRNRPNHFVGIELAGKSYHDFGYQKFTLAENYIFFFNQKDDYSVKTNGDSESYAVHFTTYEEVETPSFCKKINHPGEVLRYLEQIDRLIAVSGNGNNLAMSSLYRLCDYIGNIQKQSYIPADRRILDAKEYMDIHYREDNCLDAVAEVCGVSRRRFNDLFREQFQTTPNRYLTACKVNQARKLLGLGYISVTEVAELCGFADIYYFSKVFKAETGVTPTEYKYQ